MKELSYNWQWGFIVKDDGLWIKYEGKSHWYSSIFIKGGILVLKYD